MRTPLFLALTMLLPRLAMAQGGPDLTTTAVTFTPATIQVGQTLTVSGNFTDTGASHIGIVRYRVALSQDAVLDPGDRTLDDDTVLFDGSGLATPFSIDITMPPEAPGTYNVFVEIDSDGMVTETDDTNNDLAAATTLTYEGADLRVGSITGPEFGFAGASYRIELTIENVGVAEANNFRYVYYYSDTPQIRVFNQALGTFGPVSVANGGSDSFVDIVTLPTSSTTGYIGVIIDQFGDIPDTSIGNNIGRIMGQVRILDPSPDLTGTIVEAPTDAAIGEQFAITRTTLNLGVADATFDYAYYLSTDPTITTTDILIFSQTNTLTAGADDYEIDLMNIPTNVLAGTYYLGMIVDPDNLVFEPNEMDNTFEGPAVEVYESAIQFTTSNLPDATVGVPYEVPVYASGPLAVSFSVESGNLPPGITLDPAGLLTGMATESGLFEFTVRANSGSAYGDRRFTILVIEATVPLEVVQINLPAGVVGRNYDATLVAVGGQSPFTWRTISDPPIGLTLDENGRLLGAPQVEGDQPFTVQVEDSVGDSATKDFLLRVITPDKTLQIVQRNLPAAVINEDYCDQSTIQLEADQGIEPYTWTAAEPPPAGMTLSTTGELCGTPTEVGVFAFEVRVSDITGLFDSARVTLEVNSESTFAIATTTLPDGEVGAAYEGAIDVFRADPPLTISVVEGAGVLPDGLTMAEDGTISGTPTTLGVSAFVVHVVDAQNRTDTQPLSIAIVEGQNLTSGGSDGCGCRGTRTRGAVWPLVLGLLLLLWRRRSILNA